MSDCYICFDTEINGTDLICCTNHQFHRKCLEKWSRNLPWTLKETMSCMICKKELPMRFLIERYNTSDLETAIKNDQADELVFMLKRFTSDSELNSKLLSWAIQYSSYESLRLLKPIIRFSRVSFHVTRKMYREPSNAGLCWFLDDWEIAPIENLTSSKLLGIMEERKRFREIFEIYRACFGEFNQLEQIRIGTYLFEAASTGQYKDLGTNPVFLFVCMALTLPKSQCSIISDLIPIISRNIICSTKPNIFNSLILICRRCKVCNSSHAWDVVMSAIKVGNTQIVDFFVNMAPELEYRMRKPPYFSISVALNLSKSGTVVKEILEKKSKFSSSLRWKISYGCGKLFRLIPFRFNQLRE